MADTLVAKGSDSKYKNHPEGQFVGQCVDAIDLGERVEQYQGNPAKLAHKCALIFRTGEKNAETGDYIDIGKEFTVSMGEKANLRKFLEAWRGKKYTADQIEAGVPLHKMAGNWALITVEHRTSGAGRTYANIAAVVGVPQQMRNSLPTFESYKRPDFWSQRKEEYGKEAQAFRAKSAAPPSDDWDDNGSGPIEDDSDLPF
jgi:hypothetical protein